jgi:hypothetical protein
MTTNRRGLLVCSRVAQVCSWAGPNLEVIIRDNSGDADKRALLSQFRRDHCNIVLAEPCDALTNFSEILRLAKGEFIYLIADDDYCFDHAVAALPGLLDQIGKDPTVAGVTGLYAVETSQSSAVVAYQNVEADDVLARLAGFLNYQGPNILHYAPVRREVVQRVFDFMNTLPFYFSFHDQIVCLLYLLNGKFARLQRLLYCYDMGPWESVDTAQAKDLDYYKSADLDPVVNKLHWFLCGFEGATLIRNADVFPDYPLEIRQRMADQWFSVNYLRFRSRPRLAYDSRFVAEAEKICVKLQTSSGQLSFQDMLVEIRNFFALFSEAHAQKYFAFWDAAINRRTLAAPRLAAAGGR